MPGFKQTMSEFNRGELHSGSKTGPVVKNRKQAVAIALSEARRSGAKVPPKKKAGKKKGMKRKAAKKAVKRKASKKAARKGKRTAKK